MKNWCEARKIKAREKDKSVVKSWNMKDREKKLVNKIMKATRKIEKLVHKLEPIQLYISDSEDDSASDSNSESGYSSDNGRPTVEQGNKEKQKEPKMKIKNKRVQENEGDEDNKTAIIEHEVALVTKVDASVAEAIIEVKEKHDRPGREASISMKQSSKEEKKGKEYIQE